MKQLKCNIVATVLKISQKPIKVANLNVNRSILRFQNVGNTYIYLQRIPLKGSCVKVSPTHFEVVLAPKGNPSGAPEVFETQSILSYQAVSGPCCHPETPIETTINTAEIKVKVKSKDKGNGNNNNGNEYGNGGEGNSNGNGNSEDNKEYGNGCSSHHRKCHGLLAVQDTVKSCISFRPCNNYIYY